MTDEATADSGSESSFDMESAQAEISEDLFPEAEAPEEVVEEIVEEVTEEIVEEETPKEVIEARKAPQSWKKEMHEFWNGVDPAVQEYIEQRESQMREGLEKDRGDADLGRTMRDIMLPHSELLKSQNVNEADAVKYLMSAHQQLSSLPADQKLQALTNLAKSYGINLDGSQPEVNPEIQKLQQELSGIKSTLTRSQQATQQAAQERVNKDVEAFASDHEHFDELSDEMIPFINAGQSLEEAYEKAIWANPVTREKENARILEEREAERAKVAKQEVEKAKKAKGTNVKSRDTRNAPTGPTGSIEDTMRETYREIQNRT